MKAVLVLDELPNSCEECVVRCDGYTPKEYAQRTLIKPTWCPLKLLPQQRTTIVTENGKEPSLVTVAYLKGWNDCIEEITK